MATYTGRGASIYVEQLNMISTESNLLTITASTATEHSYKSYTITWNQTVPSSNVKITFTLDGKTVEMIGYTSLSAVSGGGFYAGASNLMDNLISAIQDSDVLNGYIDAEYNYSSHSITLQQKYSGKKLSLTVSSTDNIFTITSSGNTSWTNSLGDSDTLVELRIYGDTGETGMEVPSTVISKYYKGGFEEEAEISFQLGNIFDYLTKPQNLDAITTATLPASFTTKYYDSFKYDVYTNAGGNYTNIINRSEVDSIYVAKGIMKDITKDFNDYLISGTQGELTTTVHNRVWNAADTSFADYISYGIYSLTGVSGINIQYKYYSANGTLISSSAKTPVYSTTAKLAYSVKVSPTIPNGCDYFYAGLVNNSDTEYTYGSVRYQIINRYNEGRKLIYINSLGGAEIFDFCGNENLETLSRKGTFTSYTLNTINSNYNNAGKKTYKASSEDTYTLRSGLLPKEIVDNYSWELCNTCEARLYDENTLKWRPVIITSLENEMNTNKSNGIIEIEYQFAN